MKTIPVIAPAKQLSQSSKYSRRRTSAFVRHLAHDLINHLSVISLCCSKLGDTLEETHGSPRNKEFEIIERAVTEAAALVAKIVNGSPALKFPCAATTEQKYSPTPASTNFI
jgi:light-regulated signal transduction histidine kinase (bacteriophytochrome)